MPALIIDLQHNWRDYLDHAFLGLLIGTLGGAAICVGMSVI